MAPPRPSVSVLLPVRDGLPHLPEALASIAGQTLDDFEVLLQDDGSSDATPAVARDAARRDPRVRVATGPPRGLVAALNEAAARARGDLLVRMDADDVAAPTRLEALRSLAGRRPDAGFLASRVRYFPRRAVRAGMRRYEAWVNDLVTHEAIHRDRFVECPLPHPAWALRQEVFDALGGYREGPFPEDYDLFLRAAAAGVRFLKHPDVLLHWREGPHRLCRTDPRYGLDRFLDLKARHLVPLLRRLDRPLAVVGGGRDGKRWLRRLRAEGLEVPWLVDLHPRRVGERIHGARVLAYEDLERAREAFLLAAVGRPGGREDVRARLRAAGREEERDFLCVQ